MTEWLTLYEPIAVRNGFGEEETTYAERKMVHAERVNFSGRRSEEVGEHFPDYSVRWNIADAHTVKENWRVKDRRSGYLYTVVAIEPNKLRAFQTLICERVNE